jgi:hypothetical protein
MTDKKMSLMFGDLSVLDRKQLKELAYTAQVTYFHDDRKGLSYYIKKFKQMGILELAEADDRYMFYKLEGELGHNRSFCVYVGNPEDTFEVYVDSV